MLIQGAVLTYLFGRLSRPDGRGLGGVTFAWLAGAMLVSNEALAEPAKYVVPDVSARAARSVGLTAAGLSTYPGRARERRARRAPSSRVTA